MAKLINGNGNKAIWAAQDADLIASIWGKITSIAAVGSEFSYTQEDANTIGVSDGVIITKEGRRIQLDTGSIDLFTIPTGLLGATNYYIIGYKLVQSAETVQTCETFVQKMDNSTDVITENTFKGGATEVYVSLYRVTQVGMNIDSINLLLPKLSNVAQLISDLTANNQHYQASYSGGKYGFTINGTFYEIGGGSMPTLDYTTPLYTFGSGALSYTATKECYLVGALFGGQEFTVSINGVIYAAFMRGVQDQVAVAIPPLKLSVGDIVTCNVAPARPYLHVCKVKS